MRTPFRFRASETQYAASVEDCEPTVERSRLWVRKKIQQFHARVHACARTPKMISSVTREGSTWRPRAAFFLRRSVMLQKLPNESRRLPLSSVSLSLGVGACGGNDLAGLPGRKSFLPYFLQITARSLTSSCRRHAGFVQTSYPPLCQRRRGCVIRHPHNERHASLLSSASRVSCGLERATATRCACNARALAEPKHACAKATTRRKAPGVGIEAALTVR